jgi:hypothetical protein
MKGPKCHYCDQPGVFLCDHVFNVAEILKNRGRGPEPKVCGRRLCPTHAATGASFVACGPRKGHASRETLHYCPEHKGEHVRELAGDVPEEVPKILGPLTTERRRQAGTL